MKSRHSGGGARDGKGIKTEFYFREKYFYESVQFYTLKMYEYQHILLKEYATVRGTISSNRLYVLQSKALSAASFLPSSETQTWLSTLCFSFFCLKYFCGAPIFFLQWLSLFFFSVSLQTYDLL